MKEILTKQELMTELEQGGFVVIEYFAPWCTPCKALAMVLERNEETLKNKGVRLVKVNIENPEFADSVVGMRSVPMLMLHEGTKLVSKVSLGQPSMQLFNEWLEGNMVDFGDF